MATFLKHIGCSVCGSADNRGVWDDGSEWCFGCSSYTPPNGQAVVKHYMNRKQSKNSYNIVKLPEDALPYLPNHAKKWLEKYRLTKDEMSALAPLYSFEKDLLIFPIYAQGEIIMYQGRYFGDNPKHPKYLTYGAKDVLHILGNHSTDAIVCTEDVISAVKVSTVINAMPLWGSNMPLGTATRLSNRFSRVGLWLDMDKAKESLKSLPMLSPIFKRAVAIISPLDPKEYSHDEITTFVKELL